MSSSETASLQRYRDVLAHHGPRTLFQRGKRFLIDHGIHAVASALNRGHDLHTAAKQGFDALNIDVAVHPQHYSTLDEFKTTVLDKTSGGLVIGNHSILLGVMAPMYITAGLSNVKIVVGKADYTPFTKLFGAENFIVASKKSCPYVVDLIHDGHLVIFFPAGENESHAETIFFRDGFFDVVSQLSPTHDIVSVYTDNSYVPLGSRKYRDIVSRLGRAALGRQKSNPFPLPVHVAHHPVSTRQEQIDLAYALDYSPHTAAKNFYLETFGLHTTT